MDNLQTQLGHMFLGFLFSDQDRTRQGPCDNVNNGNIYVSNHILSVSTNANMWLSTLELTKIVEQAL